MENSQVIALVAIAISIISIVLVVANVFNLQNTLINLNTDLVEQSQTIKTLDQQQNATQQILENQKMQINQLQNNLTIIFGKTKLLDDRISSLEQRMDQQRCLIPEGCSPPIYSPPIAGPCSNNNMQSLTSGITLSNSSKLTATNVTLSAIDVAITSYSTPDTNHGGQDLMAKCHTAYYGGVDNRKGWLKFDLPVPPVKITHAVLRLYLKGVEANGSVVDVYREDNNSWSQNSITYDNEPAHFSSLSAGPFARQSFDNVNQFHNIDVTNAIVSSPDRKTVTLVLVGNSYNNYAAVYGNTQASTAPQLVLSYSSN